MSEHDGLAKRPEEIKGKDNGTRGKGHLEQQKREHKSQRIGRVKYTGISYLGGGTKKLVFSMVEFGMLPNTRMSSVYIAETMIGRSQAGPSTDHSAFPMVKIKARRIKI